MKLRRFLLVNLLAVSCVGLFACQRLHQKSVRHREQACMLGSHCWKRLTPHQQALKHQEMLAQRQHVLQQQHQGSGSPAMRQVKNPDF